MTAVYILLCANGQYYVGSTNNLADRLKEHEGSATALYAGAKFTKAHMPVKLVYTEEYEDEHQARMREQQLQGSKDQDQGQDQGDRNFYTQYIPSHLLKQIA